MPVANRQLIERCLEECLRCLRLTSECVDACLAGEQVKAMARCIRLCLDCGDLCAACAEALGRNSEFGPEICRILADVCEACAAECEKFGDDIMRRCAEACRQVARQVAAAA